MGNSCDSRHGSSSTLSKACQSKGRSPASGHFNVFRRGDQVDIVVGQSVQKRMPYPLHRAMTGVVFGVSRIGVGIEMKEVVGNRQLFKRMHVRAEHLRHSRMASSKK